MILFEEVSDRLVGISDSMLLEILEVLIIFGVIGHV
jgi:hypothetical protein